MKRTIRPEEARLWSAVTGTVRPARASRKAPPPPEPADPNAAAAHLPLEALISRRVKPPQTAPEGIEPNRKRRSWPGRTRSIAVWPWRSTPVRPSAAKSAPTSTSAGATPPVRRRAGCATP